MLLTYSRVTEWYGKLPLDSVAHLYNTKNPKKQGNPLPVYGGPPQKSYHPD